MRNLLALMSVLLKQNKNIGKFTFWTLPLISSPLKSVASKPLSRTLRPRPRLKMPTAVVGETFGSSKPIGPRPISPEYIKNIDSGRESLQCFISPVNCLEVVLFREFMIMSHCLYKFIGSINFRLKSRLVFVVGSASFPDFFS